MKNHKATAQDPIPVEIYKYSKSKRLSVEIEKIIQECWHTSNVPDTFLDIILCSLFKSGNKQMCENQRGISLLSHLCKALTRLCANRISQYCEKEGILPESQSAFRKKQKYQRYGFHSSSSSILLYGQKHPTVLGIYRYCKSL